VWGCTADRKFTGHFCASASGACPQSSPPAAIPRSQRRPAWSGQATHDFQLKQHLLEAYDRAQPARSACMQTLA
jgi:hypothetical protein